MRKDRFGFHSFPFGMTGVALGMSLGPLSWRNHGASSRRRLVRPRWCRRCMIEFRRQYRELERLGSIRGSACSFSGSLTGRGLWVGFRRALGCRRNLSLAPHPQQKVSTIDTTIPGDCGELLAMPLHHDVRRRPAAVSSERTRRIATYLPEWQVHERTYRCRPAT